MAVWAGCAPNRTHFNILLGFLHYFHRLAALFVDVGFHHLGREPGGELAVLSALEENAYNQLRVSAGRNSDELGVVFVVLLAVG